MLETWCNVQRAKSGIGQVVVRLVIEPAYQMSCLSSRDIIILKIWQESYSQSPLAYDFWASERRTLNFFCRRKTRRAVFLVANKKCSLTIEDLGTVSFNDIQCFFHVN